MWYCWLAFGIVLFIGALFVFLRAHYISKIQEFNDYIDLNEFISFVLMIINMAIIAFSASAGFSNFAQIPRVHQNIRLEEINKKHYHTAMAYNFGDESNERKTASHVRWFKNGDFSESKDNKTWKQNYDDWFYNKSLIAYHKMQLKYYSHPVENWRDGIGMRSLRSSIHKPANY